MRSIDNCYRKCFVPFAVSCCCWRWYNNNVEELPRWSLLWSLSHFFNSIETASKAIAFNSGSGFFLFFSLFFLHTKRQNDFLLLRLHQCSVCIEKCSPLCYFYFLCISFELNTCASFIFFDYFFWCNVRLFPLLLKLCLCCDAFAPLILCLFLLLLLLRLNTSLHKLFLLAGRINVVTKRKKTSKTIYFCRPIYFPSILL